MINPHPPFHTSQANSPNHFNLFLLYPFDKIDEINYLHFIYIIGTIENQRKMQTQLQEQWSHHITVYGPQQHYGHHNSNNILLQQPQPGSKCSSECWGTYEKRGIPT